MGLFDNIPQGIFAPGTGFPDTTDFSNAGGYGITAPQSMMPSQLSPESAGQQPAAPPMPIPDGGLLHPPEAPKQPGFLEHINTPDPTSGLSMVDKFQRLGAVLRDNSDPDAIIKDAKEQRNQIKQQHDLAVKNAAFRAAYQGGKFDPTAYVNAMQGQNIDPTEVAKMTQSFAPKRQVVQQGTHVISVDPNNPGDVQPVMDFPEAAKDQVTKGFYEDDEGNWKPQPGGPYDPNYIKAAAAAARKPGGGGGGVVSRLPNGFQLDN